ncbi:MAG: hypothetical protein WCC30_13380 [Candidatus Dormiibacterota bacterium]
MSVISGFANTIDTTVMIDVAILLRITWLRLDPRAKEKACSGSRR